MHFLFEAGDILIVCPIAFDEVKKGDVLVFQQAEKTIVHRVRRRTHDELVTMGDNNIVCDAGKLTRDDALFLVEYRIDRHRKKIPVRRGWRGMIRFFRDRLLHFVVRALSFCGRRIVRSVDWRIPLPAPEKFGDEFCYMVRGRMVAWKNSRTKVVQFSRLRDRLKYRSK